MKREVQRLSATVGRDSGEDLFLAAPEPEKSAARDFVRWFVRTAFGLAVIAGAMLLYASCVLEAYR